MVANGPAAAGGGAYLDEQLQKLKRGGGVNIRHLEAFRLWFAKPNGRVEGPRFGVERINM